MCNEAVALRFLLEVKKKQEGCNFNTLKIEPVKDHLKNCAHKSKVQSTTFTSSNLQLTNKNHDEVHNKYLEELISPEVDSIMQLSIGK